MPRRGEIWWVESPGEKRRPALVLTRSEAVPVLSGIVVAPLTTTARGIPTEVAVGPGDGVPKDSVISLDNVQRAAKWMLVERITELGVERQAEVCRALAVSVGC